MTRCSCRRRTRQPRRPDIAGWFLKIWIQTLDELQALDVAHFVPGHGDLMTRHDVTALRDAMLQPCATQSGHDRLA